MSAEALGINDVAEASGVYRCSECGARKHVEEGRRPGPCAACHGRGICWELEVADGAPTSDTGTWRPRGSALPERPVPEELAERFEGRTWRPGGSRRARAAGVETAGTNAMKGPVFVKDEEA